MEMREIKFRAWDINEKKMRYMGDSYVGDFHCFWRWHSRYASELMQYTGLKDKNGKEIYEGDILLINGKKGVVGFRDGSFISLYDWEELKGTYVNGSMWKGKELITTFDSNREVIGNIYKNPELLKEKK